MAKINVKGLIDKHTVDEVTDFAKVNEELENQNKNIVAKEVAKEAKKYEKDTVINEFLTENEFKSLDDFKAFKKNGATADTEAVTRLENELKEANGKVKDLSGVETKLAKYENYDLLRKKGNVKEGDVDYYEYKISQSSGDTFEEKYASFVEANPDVFTVEPPKNNRITTGATTRTKANSNKLGWEQALELKNPNLKL